MSVKKFLIEYGEAAEDIEEERKRKQTTQRSSQPLKKYKGRRR